ncbi:MAG: hypothetical protein H0U57_02055 [Tatlockia sp.]|nr:hypothetical protein [Tatlockia sp.]
MLNHDDLVRIANALGHESITFNGLCKGFTGMWIQAVCCGDAQNFERRLQLLDQYAQSPEKLIRDISRARQGLKIKSH